MFEGRRALSFAAWILTVSIAAPAAAVTIEFSFDFIDDQYDAVGTMSFDNDPGAGSGFSTTLDQLTNLSIDWSIPNTDGFDQDDLVPLLNQTELVASGLSPARAARFDHVLPLLNAVWINSSGDSMTFITNGLAGDGIAVLLVPLVGVPTSGTFTAIETVPEPASGAMLVGGLLGLALAGRRRPAR